VILAAIVRELVGVKASSLLVSEESKQLIIDKK
jgi:hypothetical protein